LRTGTAPHPHKGPCPKLIKHVEARETPKPRYRTPKSHACFVVRDHNGQQLAYVYLEDEPGRRSAAKLLTRDEARRIAAKDATGICVQLAAQTMSVPILTVTLSAKLELH